MMITLVSYTDLNIRVVPSSNWDMNSNIYLQNP
jgi:hypothetical protein